MMITKDTTILTRADGKTAMVNGKINDKIFAAWKQSNPALVSYKVVTEEVEYEKSAKEKELDNYYKSLERIERAMNY